MASQMTVVSIVCSTICSGTDQRKHQSSAPLAFIRRIQRWRGHRWFPRTKGQKRGQCFHLMMSSIWWRHRFDVCQMQVCMGHRYRESGMYAIIYNIMSQKASASVFISIMFMIRTILKCIGLWHNNPESKDHGTNMGPIWAPSQYKDRLIYVWWFPC